MPDNDNDLQSRCRDPRLSVPDTAVSLPSSLLQLEQSSGRGPDFSREIPCIRNIICDVELCLMSKSPEGTLGSTAAAYREMNWVV